MTDVLISADSHVMEDPHLWERRLPAALRDQAPVFPERELGGHFQAHPGGWDPAARVGEMAADGVSAEVLYPSFGLDLFGMKDAALQEACFRVYNDWIAEYCSAAPERLFGIPMISAFDINHAVAELERCRAAGLIGALIWQEAPAELPFGSDHYEPLWAAAEALDAPISLHILTGPRHPWPREFVRGRREARQSFREAVNLKLLDASNAVSDLISTGVLERHPNLKFVLVENEISWIPFYLSQYDKYFGRGTLDSPMKLSPGEYFERQFFATFFNDPPAGWLLGHWGTNSCMWSNDYPHPNSTWPNSREVIARDLGHLPEAARARLLRDNVAELYKLPLPVGA
jgi:predicted TIM-barrel fold metal-dependent hydrolase